MAWKDLRWEIGDVEVDGAEARRAVERCAARWLAHIEKADLGEVEQGEGVGREDKWWCWRECSLGVDVRHTWEAGANAGRADKAEALESRLDEFMVYSTYMRRGGGVEKE